MRIVAVRWDDLLLTNFDVPLGLVLVASSLGQLAQNSWWHPACTNMADKRTGSPSKTDVHEFENETDRDNCKKFICNQRVINDSLGTNRLRDQIRRANTYGLSSKSIAGALRVSVESVDNAIAKTKTGWDNETENKWKGLLLKYAMYSKTQTQGTPSNDSPAQGTGSEKLVDRTKPPETDLEPIPFAVPLDSDDESEDNVEQLRKDLESFLKLSKSKRAQALAAVGSK